MHERGIAQKQVPFAREQKARVYGESKIEQGLKNFFVYRVARSRAVERLESTKKGLTGLGMADILERAIFFTTQRNMAMEYAGTHRKPVLIRVRGMDFLEDLKRAHENIECVLLDQSALVTYQRLFHHGTSQTQHVEAFFSQNTYPIEQVSLRKLRAAKEIILLLPPGVDRLPFRKDHVKITTVESKRERKNFGEYHKTAERVASAKEGEFDKKRKYFEALKKELERLQQEVYRLEQELLTYPSESTDAKKALLTKKLEAMRSRVWDLELKIKWSKEDFVQLTRYDKQDARGAAKRMRIRESLDGKFDVG